MRNIDTDEPKSDSSRLTRRLFFGSVAASGAALSVEAQTTSANPAGTLTRSQQAFNLRQQAAGAERDAVQPTQTPNGDETLYASKIGNFTKGMPHNSLGEVDLNAYSIFLSALTEDGRQSDIEKVPMGSPDPTKQLKFTNPLAGLDYDTAGADSHHLSIAAAPAIASAQCAGEMVEHYWHALTRDVNFTDYDSNSTTQAAAAELSKLSDFRGPKVNNTVLTRTLFRGSEPGVNKGPYISQFLLKPIPFGVQYVQQQMRCALPGIDFMTTPADWLSVQNGMKPSAAIQYDATRRYIRNGRDLGQWVHIDVLYQAYFNAMLMLITPPDASDTVTGGGMGAPLNPGNPYLSSFNQQGFGTFGAPGIATAVAENAARALKTVWYQKWYVHRRLRPEAFGGLVHNNLAGLTNYPLHSDVLNSQGVQNVYSQHGSWLLPIAFPEGSPLHPAYGAGHATVAGACVTILKALFDENYVIPNPVVASSDGLSLVPYTGPNADSLTVGGELNKLAANIAIGRNFAGMHWRSDYYTSVRLGERLAVSVLKDQKLMYLENFSGFTFTNFDGNKITV